MPHQRRTCSGLVIASNTSARGASKRRVRTISRSDGVVALNESVFAAPLPIMFLLLLSEFTEVDVEPIETRVPEVAIALRPVRDLLQRFPLDPARPPLRLAPARDEPGALEHPEVF